MSEQSENIQSLLDRADVALARRALDEADRLYLEAVARINSQDPFDQANFDRAVSGRKAVRQQRPKSPTRTPLAAAGGETPAVTSVVDVQLQHVQDRAAEAESYLEQESNEHYKQAIWLYQQILDFSIVTGEDRRRYAARLSEIEQLREQFLARFNALITARQLKDDAEALISLRKLIAAGTTIGPDHEDVAIYLADRRDLFVKKLLRTAEEEANQAATARQDGLDFFEAQKFSAAIEHYASAIERIEEIKLLAASDAADEKEPDQPTRDAIVYLREQIRQLPEITAAIERYRQGQQRAIQLRNQSAELSRRYQEAEQAYIDSTFIEAINRFKLIAEMLKPDTSEQIERLLALSLKSQGPIAVEGAYSLLHRARVAIQADQVEEAKEYHRLIIESIIYIESGEREEIRREAAQIQEQIDRINRTISDDLRQIRQATRSNEADFRRDLQRLGDLIGKLQASEHPLLQEAQKLHYTLLIGQAERTEQLAAQAEQSNHTAPINAALVELGMRIRELSQHDEAADVRRLRSRLDRLIDRLTARLNMLRGYETERQRLIEYLKTIEDQLHEGGADCQAKLESLAHLRSSSLIDQELLSHISSLEQKLQAALVDELWEKIRIALPAPAEQANPEQALELLQQLSILVPDDRDLEWFRDRAERMQQRRKGLKAYRQDDWAMAYELLRRAQPQSDSEVGDALYASARRYAEKLIGEGEHLRALDILKVANPTDPLVQQLRRTAQAGSNIERAQSAIEDYDLDTAEMLIKQFGERSDTSVMKLRAAMAEAQERQQSVNETIQHAEDRRATFEKSRRRNDLREAITIIDQRLATLPVSDTLSTKLTNLRKQIEMQYDAAIEKEITPYLDAGRTYAQQHAFGQAITAFQSATQLAEGERRQEIERLLQETRDTMTREQRGLAQEARALLLRQDLREATLTQLLTHVEAAIPWDRHSPVDLKSIAGELQSAQQILTDVEVLLAEATKQWYTTHTQAMSRKPVLATLDKASAQLAATSFGHIALTSPEHSLLRQAAQSEERFTQAQHEERHVRSQIAQETLDMSAIEPAYARLAEIEQALLGEINDLARDGWIPATPSSWAERFPLQHILLDRLVQQHNEIHIEMQRNSRLTDEQLDQALSQARQIKELLARLDPKNGSGLQQMLN